MSMKYLHLSFWQKGLCPLYCQLLSKAIERNLIYEALPERYIVPLFATELVMAHIEEENVCLRLY